jgi:hypothetical protein
MSWPFSAKRETPLERKLRKARAKHQREEQKALKKGNVLRETEKELEQRIFKEEMERRRFEREENGDRNSQPVNLVQSMTFYLMW